METISNVVNTASKAIWGDQSTTTATGNETAGHEPVSGMQGKGTVDEPFDQGNASNPTTSAGKSDLTDRTITSNSNPSSNLTSSTTDPSTSAMSEPSSTKLGGPSATDNIPTNPNNAAAGGTPDPLANTEGTGVTGSSAQKYAPTGGDIVPSSASSNPGAAPASGAAPGQKQQGADRPQDAPSDQAAREDNPEALLKRRDPNDHSGEPMHMHGASDAVPATQAERRESKVGNPGGQEHGNDEPKGTGEKWVKTSGLAADGGDFDATKPGAGREAERLLEEKGIHKDSKGAMDNPTAATTGTGSDHSKDSKDKVSKLDKIKDKLHIGHKDK